METALASELSKNSHGQPYDGLGRKIVKLPPRPDLDNVGVPDGHDSKPIEAIMADEDRALDPEAGEKYEGVRACMKHDVGSISGGSRSGKARKKPREAGWSEATSLRESQKLAQSGEGRGAGRPRLPEDEKRVVIQLSVARSTAAHIRKHGRAAGRFVDEAFSHDVDAPLAA